jgi:hypothetical protein
MKRTWLSLIGIAGCLVLVLRQAILWPQLREVMSPAVEPSTGRRQRTSSLVVPTASLVERESKCIAGASLRPRHGPSLTLSHSKSRLLVMSTPKGGASLTAQLFFRHLGLLEKALETHPFIHVYRKQWSKDHNDEKKTCRQVCNSQEGWHCFMFVRSPLDRAISAYHHTMRTGIKDNFPELQTVLQISNKSVTLTSFADFLQALHGRAAADVMPQRISSPMDDHFMPQAEYTCQGLPHMHYVPIETATTALQTIAQMNNNNVILNATGLTSGHYVSKSGQELSSLPDASHFPPPPSGSSLPYDAYLQNSTINTLLCSLYCHDIVLYRASCNNHPPVSSWLASSPTAQQICATQLQRIDQVCGKVRNLPR